MTSGSISLLDVNLDSSSSLDFTPGWRLQFITAARLIWCLWRWWRVIASWPPLYYVCSVVAALRNHSIAVYFVFL